VSLEMTVEHELGSEIVQILDPPGTKIGPTEWAGGERTPEAHVPNQPPAVGASHRAATARSHRQRGSLHANQIPTADHNTDDVSCYLSSARGTARNATRTPSPTQTAGSGSHTSVSAIGRSGTRNRRSRAVDPPDIRVLAPSPKSEQYRAPHLGQSAVAQSVCGEERYRAPTSAPGTDEARPVTPGT
jgi:hypothetical protein